MRNLAIIARYHEDISWVDNLNCEYVIYNKGNDFPFPYEKIDIPNQGREAETYIRAAVDLYDRFREYDNIFFVQGHPFDSNPDAVDDINNFNHKDKLVSLSDNERILTGFDQDFAHGKNIAVVDKLTFGKYFANVDQFKEGAIKSNLLAYVLNIHKVPITWWSGNAQYAVPTSKILNKSHKWWKDTLKVVHFYEQHTNESIGHVMEHLWPRIFEYSEYWNYETEGPLKGKI